MALDRAGFIPTILRESVALLPLLPDLLLSVALLPTKGRESVALRVNCGSIIEVASFDKLFGVVLPQSPTRGTKCCACLRSWDGNSENIVKRS